jgi:predicted Zn-dependent peptidase
MRLKALFLIFFVGVIAASLVAGCANTSKLKGERIITDVDEFTVDGIDVLLRHSESTPVISAVLFIKGGSSVLAPSEPASTEYFAMRIGTGSGTEHMSKSDYRRALLRLGSNISGDDGRDFSLLSLLCVGETWDSSWKYFGDVVTHPNFDRTEFENMRSNVLVELGSVRNDADRYSHTLADSIYFQGHPYGRRLTSDDVNQLTLDGLREHYKSIMVKSRLLLAVVGNVTKDDLIKKIRESGMPQLPQGSFVDQPLTPPAKALSPGAYFFPFGRKLPTNYTLGYYLIPSKGDSDYYPYVRLRNFFGGFVFNHIRVQHNLAYAPNVDEEEAKTSLGIISFQTAYVDSAVKLVDEDIDFFQDNLIRESAIREGVGRWTTSNYVKAETAQSQAVNLGEAKIWTGDWRNAFVSYEKLASVTPEQLQHAALKYLRNINWVVVGDTTGLDRDLLLSR